MSVLNACPQCGSKLLRTHEGLCATCLLEAGLADSGIFHIAFEKSIDVGFRTVSSNSSREEERSLESTDLSTKTGDGAAARTTDETRTFAGLPSAADSAVDATSELSADDLSLDFLAPSDKLGCLGTLGIYEITEVIGRGGFGIVLKGIDPNLNRVAAIKALSPELASDPTARKRFLREARSAAAVNHPNAVEIYDIDDNALLPYLVMEFVDGATVGDRVKQQGPLPIEEILRIGAQAAAGLAAAHACGLIHRDIKPGNILLPTNDEQAKITDFGLARTAEDAHLTRTGTLAGTPQYMSPEQADGKDLDARTDLFSLGSVLYAMCTGEPPFRGDSTVAVLQAVCDDEPPQITKLNRRVPKWLSEIVAKLLAKNPDDRFQSADEVAKLLKEHLAHLRNPKENARPKPIRLSKSGKPRRSLVAAAVLFVVFGGLALTEATGITGVVNFVTTVLRIQTPDGTLVVKVDDPNIEIEVTKDGTVVITGAGPQELRLQPGRYQVKATGGGQTKTELITIERGGHRILEVRFEPAVASIAKLKSALAPSPSFGQPILTLQQHRSTVRGVAWSPDSKRILSGSWGATLKIWDADTGQEIRTLKGLSNKDHITCVAWSPDGKRILAGFVDNTVKVWDANTGEKIHTIQGHKGIVHSVAWSPDGKRMLSGAYDRTIKVWDPDTGKEIRTFEGHTKWVLSVAWSPDGGRVVSGAADKDNTVKVWDADTGKVIHTLKGHTDNVTCVAWSPDSKRVVSGSFDHTIKVWDADTGKDIHTLKGHTDRVKCLAWSPDGKLLISWSYDHTIKVWDADTGKEIRTFNGHTKDVCSIAFSPDGKRIASGSGNTVKVWDAKTGLAIAPFDAQQAKKHQQAWAKHLGIPVETTNSIGLKLRLIPPGQFEMRSKYDVTISKAFQIGTYEVTIAQFREFVEDTGYKTSAEVLGNGNHMWRPQGKMERRADFTWQHKDVNHGDNYPVAQLSWNDAVKFCEWLSRKEGKRYRLPTEAEWEWACRAGSLKQYFFGNDSNTLAEYAWNAKNSKSQTQPVGLKKPNPWGLFDTHGNVCEFCLDWHAQNFPNGQAKDPRGPSKGKYRVIRGGGYFGTAYSLTLGYRGALAPSGSLNHFGLRVVCEVDEMARVTPPVASLAEIATRLSDNWSLQEVIRLGPEVDRFLAKGDLAASDAKHLKSLAAAFGRGADWQRAGKLLDLFLERNPKNYWYWHHRLSVAACIGDKVKYEHCCNEIARLIESQTDGSNGNIAATTKLAAFEPKAARLEKVRALAERLEKKWPNDVGSLNARAQVLYAEGDTDGCRKLLKQIPIDAGNQFFKIRTALLAAKCAAKSGDQPTAKEALEKATKLLEPECSSGDLGNPNCWVVAECVALIRDAEIAIHGKAVTPQLTPQRLADLVIERISSLPAAEQVDAVYNQLKQRNPKFDGKWWNPTIENDVITGLHFCTDHVMDISPVRALTHLRVLRINGNEKYTRIDLSPLKGMSLTNLEVLHNHVDDLSPLRGMPLQRLHLWTAWAGSDLSPLKGMPLKFLNIGGGGEDVDLTPLAGLPLDYLCLNYRKVSDLTPLKNTRLRKLDCTHTLVSDLSPLRKLPLVFLAINNSRVTDLSPITDLPLEHLACDFQASRDTPILREIKTLKKINDKPAAEFWKNVEKQGPAVTEAATVYQELKQLNPNFDGTWWNPTIENGVVTGLRFCTDHVADISPVRALAHLRSLQMHGRWLKGSLVDLSPLKGMKLTVLGIPNNKVVDLAPLRGMPLQYLQLLGCPASDLTPLAGMPLKELDLLGISNLDLTQLAGLPLDFLCLNNTKVSDLTPLKNLPLTRLMCNETQVSDLTPLQGMRLRQLHVMKSKVTDLSPIKGMPLENLMCDFEAKRDTPILREIKTLKRINDKPAAEFWKDVDEQQKKADDGQPQARGKQRPKQTLRAATVRGRPAFKSLCLLECAMLSRPTNEKEIASDH